MRRTWIRRTQALASSDPSESRLPEKGFKYQLVTCPLGLAQGAPRFEKNESIDVMLVESLYSIYKCNWMVLMLFDFDKWFLIEENRKAAVGFFLFSEYFAILAAAAVGVTRRESGRRGKLGAAPNPPASVKSGKGLNRLGL